MAVHNRGPSIKWWVCCLGIFALAAAGCSSFQESRAPVEAARPVPYLPPTSPAPIVDLSNLPAEPTPDLRPTPTPPCTPNLTFKDDLTIPDGTSTSPGEKLDKRWEVENSGTCNWDGDYRIRLIAGPSLGAETEQALYPARSGSTAMVRIHFTAPNEPGTYRSAWQAHRPSGEPFGDLFFVEFVVVDR